MINKVKIIGLGLMGANLGINLKSKGIDVFGQDVDKELKIGLKNLVLIQNLKRKVMM